MHTNNICVFYLYNTQYLFLISYLSYNTTNIDYIILSYISDTF